MGGGGATGCADAPGAPGAVPGQPPHRAHGQAAPWTGRRSDAAERCRWRRLWPGASRKRRRGGVGTATRVTRSSRRAKRTVRAPSGRPGTGYAAGNRETRGENSTRPAATVPPGTSTRAREAQVVDGAERVAAGRVAPVGLPAVVDAHPRAGRQDADGVGRLAAPLGVDGVLRQPRRAGHVRPSQSTTAAHAGLVMRSRRATRALAAAPP